MIDEIKVAKKLVRISQSAKDRGIAFDLSFQSLKNVMRAKKCYYTGAAIDPHHPADHPLKLTIDRVDASKGYVKGNVVACAHYMNQKKRDLTVDEILLLAKKVER